MSGAIGLNNVFAFVTVFGLLVFLHELGHFLVAKWCGVKVEVFSLGFGPRLLGWRSAGTDYRISLVPLGGYVRMLGEEADPHDPSLPPEGSFATRPRWQRFLVMVAGAVMNVILAVILVTGMNMVGREEPEFMRLPPRLAAVQAGSPAEAAGFERGDTVLEADGVAVPNWETFQQAVLFNPGRRLPVTVERDGEKVRLEVEVTLPPEESRQRRYKVGYIGLTEPAYDVRIWGVQAGSAAEAAGLEEGDLILSVDGEAVLTQEDVTRLISARPERDTVLGIRRAGEDLEIAARPANREGSGLLGVTTGPTLVAMEMGFLEAIRSSVRENIDRAGLFFVVVRKLITGGLSIQAVSGPVDIFIFSGEALRRGWLPYFDLMALFSLQLGVLNLLPIPFLDGGHIAILGIEGVLRRDLSQRLKERLLQVGLVMLLLFMGIVLYSDIAKNLDILRGLFG
jgi:regulator of sigma E protease